MFGDPLPPGAEGKVKRRPFHSYTLKQEFKFQTGYDEPLLHTMYVVERRSQAWLLAEETDPNTRHDLKAALDAAQVYAPAQVQQVRALRMSDDYGCAAGTSSDRIRARR